MEVHSIVYVNREIDQNTTSYIDAWCTNLVHQFGGIFPNIRLNFGGNTEHFGTKKITSLDKIFLPQDVANLAMLSYKESIRDKYLF